MKRILFISNYKQGVGGINNQVELLLKYTRQEGFVSDVFSTKANPVKRIFLFFRLFYVAHQYDILHIHACSGWGMLPVVYGVIVGTVWKKRIIVTYHGGGADDYFEKHGAFARRWLNRADQVIVLSGFLEKVFDKYAIPCVVIPNIIPLREGIYRTKNRIAPRFISIRHLTSLYRIDLIIRAYEQILMHYPKATLDILGQGDKREELEQYMHDHQLTGVRFVGQVPNEHIYDYLQVNDIMLSAPIIDNMPVSLLEAMNAGLLVISSNVGGVPYIVEDQKSGLLFDLDAEHLDSANLDVKRLAEKMLWALEHQAESLQMIEAAYAEVKKYSWENIRKQLLPIYE